MKKNISSQKIGAQMVSATDGSEFTGTVTVYVTLDAGTQAIGAVGSGVCTHEGHGYHTYAPSQAETNGDLCAFTFVGTGAVPATVQCDTVAPTAVVDIQARLPAALTGAGNMKADSIAIDGDTSAATRLKRGALAAVLVTIGSASTQTNIVTSSMDPAAAVTDQFKDAALVFDKNTTTVNLRGQRCRIISSTSGGVLAVTQLTTAPVSGDTAEIV